MMAKSGVLVVLLLLVVVVSSSLFQHSSSSQVSQRRRKSTLTDHHHRPPASSSSVVVLPLHGNVYPLGYYSVSVNVGKPPKVFELDIDTGSDLTWIQCDAPCTGCTKPPHQLYKPKGNLLPCEHPLCYAVHSPADNHCDSPTEQCDYVVDYADQGSSLGVLVSDNIPLRLVNGSLLSPRLSFGCGYDQKSSGMGHVPPTSGVLGLGIGRVNIVSQLQNMGLMQNIIGHCLSRRGGGFLFFGDHLVPSSGVAWMPMSHSSLDKHYSSGPAEILFGGKSTGIKGLQFIFDSGSSYTYFGAQSYQGTLKLIKNNLNGKPLRDAPEEKALPVCWKGTKPIKSIEDIKSYFKPLVIRFAKTKNVQLQLPPEDYLIVTEHGNVCLGILNATEVGLENLNIIGDISLQDKMVIYNNEKQQMGWVTANCNIIPNVDHDNSHGICQPLEADFGLQEQCAAATYTSENISKPVYGELVPRKS